MLAVPRGAAGDEIEPATVVTDIKQTRGPGLIVMTGLQLDGVASVVSESDRDAVNATYLAKFPSLQKLHQAPESEQDRQIVARLSESHFYRISPSWGRLIDNSKRFGHKEEMSF